jgi:hypothetical protein
MKLLALLSLLLVPASLLGNRAHPSSTTPNSPFDDYGNMCWEDERARLDNFAIQLQNQPTATGEIMVYAGRISCNDEAKYRANRARDWLKKRGVPSHQIIVKDGGFQAELRTILIVVPKGDRSWDYPSSLSKEKVSVRRHCVGKVFARVLCLNK